MTVLDADVHGVGVAKEVVHVAEYLLIGTHKEDAEVVRLVAAQGMEGQHMREVALLDEVGYLAIRVAGDILQGCVARRPFGKALNGHYGEQLVDGPRVGEALEQREVAEILVGEQLVDIAQLFGHVLHLLGERIDFMAYAPVHALNLGTGLEVYDAMREELEGLVAYLLGIMPVFEHILGVEVVPYLVEVLDQLVVGVLGLKLLGHLGQAGGLEHVDNQYRVVCRERPAALGDDVGMGYVVLVGCVDEGIDTVVDILLDRVVDRALAVGRAGAVVVHSQSAATVDEVHVVPHLV